MTDCENCAALRARIAAIEAALKVKSQTLQRVYTQYTQAAARLVRPDEFDEHWRGEEND